MRKGASMRWLPTSALQVLGQGAPGDQRQPIDEQAVGQGVVGPAIGLEPQALGHPAQAHEGRGHQRDGRHGRRDPRRSSLDRARRQQAREGPAPRQGPGQDPGQTSDDAGHEQRRPDQQG
jgi:hypothetical protein